MKTFSIGPSARKWFDDLPLPTVEVMAQPSSQLLELWNRKKWQMPPDPAQQKPAEDAQPGQKKMMLLVGALLSLAALNFRLGDGLFRAVLQRDDELVLSWPEILVALLRRPLVLHWLALIGVAHSDTLSEAACFRRTNAGRNLAFR